MSNEPAQHCTWRDTGECLWETDCGHAFEFISEGPLMAGFLFCPFCSQSLMEHPDQGDDE